MTFEVIIGLLAIAFGIFGIVGMTAEVISENDRLTNRRIRR